MKRKDVVFVVVVAVFSAIISLVVSNLLFAPPANRQQKVEVVEPISTDFTQPDNRYFNTGSIDLTQLIQIGNNNNPNPFSSGQ